MFRLNKVALQEALREKEQIDIFGVGVPCETFYARKRSLDVANDLRRLAGAYAHAWDHCWAILAPLALPRALDPEALDGPDLHHSAAESRFRRLGRAADGQILVVAYTPVISSSRQA